MRRREIRAETEQECGHGMQKRLREQDPELNPANTETPVAINWKHLRPFNGSQQHAFEELCCQLARYEQMPPGSKFIRKGMPDGGVECFWTQPNGEEFGWQAKFFQSSPTSGEWGQVDDSVKTALEKHPRLISYTICMAVDLSDAKLEGQKSAQQKWDAHVRKWTGWARDKSVSAEFPFWGSHEITERLSRDEHRGRTFFWFHEECLTHRWFDDHITVAVANAGPRYTPELNIELPLVSIFESLGHTSWFSNELKRISGEIRRGYARADSNRTMEQIADKVEIIGENVGRVLQILGDVDVPGSCPADFQGLRRHLDQASRTVWDCRSALREASEKKKRDRSAAGADQSQQYYGPTEFDHAQYDFVVLGRELSSLSEFIDSRASCKTAKVRGF